MEGFGIGGISGASDGVQVIAQVGLSDSSLESLFWMVNVNPPSGENIKIYSVFNSLIINSSLLRNDRQYPDVPYND